MGARTRGTKRLSANSVVGGGHQALWCCLVADGEAGGGWTTNTSHAPYSPDKCPGKVREATRSNTDRVAAWTNAEFWPTREMRGLQAHENCILPRWAGISDDS